MDNKGQDVVQAWTNKPEPNWCLILGARIGPILANLAPSLVVSGQLTASY
ncbi:hypothetical protein ABIB48_003010 [Arthrobacter sp. UYCu511]